MKSSWYTPGRSVPKGDFIHSKILCCRSLFTRTSRHFFDRRRGAAHHPGVVDFTHSTRAMLITVDPAPRRLRLPRTGGLGSAISVATRASIRPADRRPVFTKRADMVVPAVTSPGRGNTDFDEFHPSGRRQ